MEKSDREATLYDVFICHASEDKDTVVRKLANLLRKRHIAVWYDEFSLEIGDSVRRAIDKGLRQSRFGIVVLSKAFFQKEWPQYELDGLLEMEIVGREKVLLPVWHEVTQNYVANYSPSLAGRLAAKTSTGLVRVADQLSQVIKPLSSPLVIARDYLLSWNVTPPVITDKHWLNVVQASSYELPFGAVPDESSTWGRWSFPLPPKSEDPATWGERLAWAYMQMQWVQEAEMIPITPLTHYREVLEFIHRNPGLFETCQDYPSLLVEWAPQLTISGFEGDLLKTIEKAYQDSCNQRVEIAKKSPNSHTVLTVDGTSPACEEDFALRHPNFGGYDAVRVAYAYFHGGMFGPTVSPYEEADHLFWLLSKNSKWLPPAVRKCLLDGISNRSHWLWGYISFDKGGGWETCGTLAETMYDAWERKKFRISKAVESDLENRIALSKRQLRLSEPVKDLKKRFLEHKIIGKTIAAEKEIRKRRRDNY
jgi:hypothetical protein